jgi:hypothetical protein
MHPHFVAISIITFPRIRHPYNLIEIITVLPVLIRQSSSSSEPQMRFYRNRQRQIYICEAVQTRAGEIQKEMCRFSEA